MFENYFKIAWRNLIRNKMYSLIKIGGLAMGIGACLLIGLFVRQELSYDQHYPDQERIFRIVRVSDFKGEISSGVHFPAPFANALHDDFIEFEKVGRLNQTEFFGAGENEIRRADQMESTHEGGFTFMDQELVDILRLPFIAGNPKRALLEKSSILITKRKADKYFPTEDPLGKTLILNNDESVQYTITGVVEDPPVASHLQYDFILTLAGREFYPGEQTNWQNDNYPTYVLLQSGTDVKALEKKLSLVIEKYFLPNADGKEGIAWLKSLHFQLQPIHDIYLNLDDIGDNYVSHGDIRYIWLFGAIASFILIIACINFINLSTARSANRAREVGLRRVVGSLRSSLIKQFLTESILFSAFSMAMGLVLAWLALPYYNTLLAKSLSIPWNEWWFFPSLGAGALTIGMLAGLYPSFYLSSFKPIQVLKGKVSSGSKNSTTRSVLVIFQFTISIVLIAGTVIISRQMEYMLTKKVGYDKEQVLLLQGTHTLKDEIVTFKNELQTVPGVRHVTISGYLPIEGTKRNQNRFFNDGRKEIDEPVGAQRWEVDHDYIKTFGLKILNGRDFSIELSSDSLAIIINRSMAKALNLNDPIGKVITNGWGKWPVIGVIEDFHFESLKHNIEPLCLMIGRSNNTVSIKVDAADMPAMVESISKVWKEFSPHQPIRYTFLDQSYARMYDDVQRMGYIFRTFATLAIIVACLGLFALSAFMVEQRNKEISIRLVLGASVSNIFRLLTGNFIKLVLISLILAIPISIYAMQEWLKDFAYKVEIGWEVFALAGIMSLLTAVLTISYQSIRAALMNPAMSLKSE